jgi:elongation factor G
VAKTDGTARLRNLGIVAHIDAGKTTVSERMLYFTGVEHQIGEVDAGTAVMDWMAEERERGITITAAATTLPWGECSINLIDTPGHVDFTAEVERSLRVLDGACLVIDAVAGVQAQSETVWRQMRRHSLSAIAFVNKCDRPGADFLKAVSSLRQRLAAPAIPIQYPLQESGELQGVIDLIGRQGLLFDRAGKGPPQVVPVPPSAADEVDVLRAELFEALAEEDERILQALLEDREPEVELLRSALRARVLKASLLPVLCGAALRNIGVHPLLDAVVDYLPSPLDVPPAQGLDPASKASVLVPPDPEAACCGLVFKRQVDAHGDLAYLRVYAGVLRVGAQLVNLRTKRPERVGRLMRMHADQRTAIDSAGPGEIVAVGGFKLASTGDTLCDRERLVLLEPPAFPTTVISMVVEPQSTGDRERLGQALERLALEDPTFQVREDPSTGQWLVSGMGELHLEVIRHRLLGDFRVQANMGEPRVAYREAVRRAGKGSGRVERAVGGRDVFGAVDVSLKPYEGPEVRVSWSDRASSEIPRAFHSAVEISLREGSQLGPMLGYPLVSAEVRIESGGSDPSRDCELGFTQAAALALHEAMGEAEVSLLEPLMAFCIEAPAEFASGIIADLNGRRAEVTLVESEAGLRRIHGTVPLAEMFGYSTAVRSLSQGRASFTLEPAGFRDVPPEDLASRGLQ